MSEEQDFNFVKLTHFSNSIEAGMVNEFLSNNGIHSILQGMNFGGLEPLLLPGGYSEITLLVPETELEQAEQLYEAFFAEQGNNELLEDTDVQV